MLTSLSKDTQYSVGNTPEFGVYENDIVSLYASSVYELSQYHSGNVIQVLLNEYFVFGQNASSWYITQTLKVPKTRITKVHITCPEIVNSNGNCMKDFVVYYLDSNTNQYIEIYRGTCTESSQEFKIEIPKDVITKSIKITPLNYYWYGPALNGFILEYQYLYSDNIFSKVKNAIANHKLIKEYIAITEGDENV